MLIEAFRRDGIRLIEYSANRYEERWFGDLQTEFQRLGKNFKQFTDCIFDEGVVWVIVGQHRGPLVVTPPKWYVDWCRVREVVVPKDLGGNPGYSIRRQVKQALREHLRKTGYQPTGKRVLKGWVDWCIEFMERNSSSEPVRRTVEGWVSSVLNEPEFN